MLLSLILFGSRARGDHRLASDVDLLGVVDGGTIKDEVSARGASFYRYPIESLRSKAEAGDLFLLHLKSEGKILHDTAGVFDDVCKRFRYRASYGDEIREASAIIWFLVDRPQLLETKVFRKRLVWGFRTILIAKSAEQQIPTFSSAALADFAGMPALKSAIDKRFVVDASELLDFAKLVTNQFGKTCADLQWPAELKAQQEMLLTMGAVARTTAQGLKAARKRKRSEASTTVNGYI